MSEPTLERAEMYHELARKNVFIRPLLRFVVEYLIAYLSSRYHAQLLMRRKHRQASVVTHVIFAEDGLANPAYTVLEFCDEGRDYDLYWKHLFMSRRFIDSLRVVTYGIRDGRSISVPEFKELFFYTPCYEEQKAIGDFFEELDRLIGLEAIELEKLKHVKSTLLRKMFV